MPGHPAYAPPSPRRANSLLALPAFPAEPP
jgi:hypothetical protein